MFNAVLMPIVVMWMFVYMLGGAFSVGVDYVDYATPGLMLLAVCYGLTSTATSVNSDMTTGIVNRFKVMDVSRSAVLTGHVVASVLTNLVALAALVGVAFLLGFDPSAGLVGWLGAVGILVLLATAAGWFTVALGLFAKSPETAALGAVPLVMLPFFSSESCRFRGTNPVGDVLDRGWPAVRERGRHELVEASVVRRSRPDGYGWMVRGGHDVFRRG